MAGRLTNDNVDCDDGQNRIERGKTACRSNTDVIPWGCRKRSSRMNGELIGLEIGLPLPTVSAEPPHEDLKGVKVGRV